MGSQLSLPHGINKIKCETQLKIQETQLSQRGRAMLGVSEYFTKPLKVTENRTIRNLGTVFHSRCIATVAVSLAVSTQYTNVTNGQTLHDGIGRAYAQHRTAKNLIVRPRGWTFSA